VRGYSVDILDRGGGGAVKYSTCICLSGIICTRSLLIFGLNNQVILINIDNLRCMSVGAIDGRD
jgi:hypothetical protein